MANAVALLNETRKIWLDRATNSSPSRTQLSVLNCGANDITPAETDTELQARLPKTATTIDACDATTGWSNAADAQATVLDTTSGERKEGTGSLALPLTFSAGSGNWDKTVSSTNLASKYLLIYIYASTSAYASLTTAADTIAITLGTGGFTNTSTWYWPKTAIKSNGWTVLYFDLSTTANATGGTGAVLSTVDRIRITVKAGSSITGTNLRMDWWHYASSTDFSVSLVAGYPTVDYTNLAATYRANIGPNDMNNYDITNSMLKNAANTPGAHAQFTAVAKTSKVKLVLQPKISVI